VNRAGGLDHHIDAERVPRTQQRLGLAQHTDGAAVDDEVVLVVHDSAGVAAVDGVVLEQLRRRRRRAADVVDGHDLDVGAVGHLPQHLSADAAEAVDGDPQRCVHATTMPAPPPQRLTPAGERPRGPALTAQRLEVWRLGIRRRTRRL